MEKSLDKTIYKQYHTNHVKSVKGDITYQELDFRFKVYNELYRDFLPLNKNAKILDAGCGNGSVVWWLHKLGYEKTFGIDISEEQIIIGKQLGIRNLIEADIFEYMKNCDKLDFVILRDVIEHFVLQDVINILKVSKKALEKNGSILIQVPNAESPFFGRILYGDITHKSAYSERSLSQLFNIVGFKNYQFYASDPYFNKKKDLKRRLIWRLVKKVYSLILYAELGTGNRIITQNIICHVKNG